MQLEIARVDVGREHADIALGQVRQELGWMLQDRKAEERRDLSESAAAMCTALMPISISTLACSASLAYGLRARSLCDQVWCRPSCWLRATWHPEITKPLVGQRLELLKVFGTALKESSHHAEMRIDATTTLLPLPFSFLRQFELVLKVGVTQ
jgi:hypothetical protein